MMNQKEYSLAILAREQKKFLELLPICIDQKVKDSKIHIDFLQKSNEKALSFGISKESAEKNFIQLLEECSITYKSPLRDVVKNNKLAREFVKKHNIGLSHVYIEMIPYFVFINIPGFHIPVCRDYFVLEKTEKFQEEYKHLINAIIYNHPSTSIEKNKIVFHLKNYFKRGIGNSFNLYDSVTYSLADSLEKCFKSSKFDINTKDCLGAQYRPSSSALADIAIDDCFKQA